MSDSLRHPLLEDVGVRHGFGTRKAVVPDGLVRPVQVHGASVATPESGPQEADAIVSKDPGFPVGIATADCVPVLATAADGGGVAAIHAGWRGLAAGVIESGVGALRAAAAGSSLLAVIGPHIGPCCYEVDEPVLGPLRRRFGPALDDALRPPEPGRPGHWMIDLGLLVALDLERAGVPSRMQGRIESSCTYCDAIRFHSYRRDGKRAGRLLHFIQPAQPPQTSARDDHRTPGRDRSETQFLTPRNPGSKVASIPLIQPASESGARRPDAKGIFRAR